ncbi:hypothetical protein EPA93_06245 [Ktedonosporobacter rubrisoli]|uniref:DUF6194 domain-containing protein n=1 Tax=Ktedonosporobacter rubrisoli TaxID=2509675 RepID=A0A4P6JLT8_KTERU|nr:DUF6194 family protein [Ktedonosporobacter rubrisoli]QBD75626.1 hypothetical protein EPA93_06245 [Ktedonosporobacter rubrisoli]
MNEFEINQYITDTFEGVDVVTDSGNSFFFHNPDSTIPPDHRVPFVTLVINDLYDQFSNLNRPSVFRLNIGIGKQTFRSLFGEPSLPSDRDSAAISGENESSYDFTALDQIMPHPVYGRIFWVCVLNPGKKTFETKVHQLLTEAYELAVSKHKRRVVRR